jgi:uncharacterized protein (DUF1501 family)
MSHPMNFDRRSALKAGVAGGLLAAMSRTSFGIAPPWMASSDQKLLTIFLRGGYDANSAVIPHADAGYTPALRGATHIPVSASLPLPGPTALNFRLNPALWPLNSLLTPPSGGPRITFLHAVGNPARTGSHFDDQRTWETAITQCSPPAAFDLEEGWVTRVVSEVLGGGFRAASVSDGMQQLYRTRLRPNNSFVTSRVLPHIRALRDFPLDVNPQYTLGTGFAAQDAKLLGSNGTPPSGLRALFNGGSQAGHFKDAFGRAVAKQLVESADTVASLVPGAYVPLGGARYPFGVEPLNPTGPYPLPTVAGLKTNSFNVRRFFMYLRDAMALLRHVPDVNVVGIELGSFDTHSDQGGWNSTTNSIEGPLAELLEAVAFGLQEIDKETGAGAFGTGNLTTLVVSEFGRTSEVNLSHGTDHGSGTCVWVAGSAVLPNPTGGVVHNDSLAQWPGLFSANDQSSGCPGNPSSPTPHYFVKPVTDFRAIYARILRTLYGATPTQLDQIIPGYSTLGLVEPNFI